MLACMILYENQLTIFQEFGDPKKQGSSNLRPSKLFTPDLKTVGNFYVRMQFLFCKLTIISTSFVHLFLFQFRPTHPTDVMQLHKLSSKLAIVMHCENTFTSIESLHHLMSFMTGSDSLLSCDKSSTFMLLNLISFSNCTI